MSTVEKVNGHERVADPVAQAEADAIRSRSYAESEAARLKAEAEAEATRIRAKEDAEKQRLANERTAMRLERERAEQAAKLAESNRKREESERQRVKAREAEVSEQQAETAQQEAKKKTANVWFGCALGFAILCGIVALPVQMSAFYNEKALWLLAAPVFLEGGAWVVLQGARAAVEDGRPHWHYRLIAWVLAFIAAGVNLKHGLDHFDAATAIGTAFASVAGPGVWDLHEHGRIRTRDGKLTRAQRSAKRAQERKAAAERKAREQAAKAAAEQLSAEREEHYSEVWAHAVKLAAAMGETTVTEAVWRRAHLDIEGADPGDSVDVIRNRNNAVRRVAAARSEAPGKTPVKVTNTQRASQMPGSQKTRSYTPPVRRGRRTKGDTPKYVSAARTQAAIAAKSAATESR